MFPIPASVRLVQQSVVRVNPKLVTIAPINKAYLSHGPHKASATSDQYPEVHLLKSCEGPNDNTAAVTGRKYAGYVRNISGTIALAIVFFGL